RIEEPLRDAALAQRARDASSCTADDHPADDRPGAAPHAPDAGADGADAAAGAGRGSAVKIVFAMALGLAAVAGVFGQSDAPAITHEYADVNGVKLHYARAGKGPLIVFLHGFPEFWYEWKHQLAEFATDHTVVAPDMRGYNLSSKPDEVAEYAVPKLVEDVRALAGQLLKSTGAPTFTLVAHDWGGAI